VLKFISKNETLDG